MPLTLLAGTPTRCSQRQSVTGMALTGLTDAFRRVARSQRPCGPPTHQRRSRRRSVHSSHRLIRFSLNGIPVSPRLIWLAGRRAWRATTLLPWRTVPRCPLQLSSCAWDLSTTWSVGRSWPPTPEIVSAILHRRSGMCLSQHSWERAKPHRGPEAERHVRLALAAARRGGFQSTELGGKGTLAKIFDDRGNQMLMASALSREPWSFSLVEWFNARP